MIAHPAPPVFAPGSVGGVNAFLSRLTFTTPVTLDDLTELRRRLIAEHVPCGVACDVILRDTALARPAWCDALAIVEVVIGGGGPAPYHGWVAVR